MHSDDDAAELRGDDGRNARRRTFTGMTARLEGHVEGAAPGTVTRRLQGDHLGMGAAGAAMVPVPDGAIFRDHDRAHHRIGGRVSPPLGGQTKRLRHVDRVAVVDFHRARLGDVRRLLPRLPAA